MRLIAFGCSQTYGHCLPDCYVKAKSARNGVGIALNPSKMAFAQLVGDYLNRTVHNLAWPGGSNRNMWYHAVHFDYQPTDMVLCVWTMADRNMVVRKNDTHHLGPWPGVHPLNKAWQRFTAMSNSDSDSELTAFHLMDHTHRVVAPKVKKILHYKQHNQHYIETPAWCNFRFQNSLQNMVPYEKMDTALDGEHYGVESHKSIARQMIQDLTTAPN